MTLASTESPWLVRTAQNRLWGPMDRNELAQRILGGEYGENDEVCCGNGEWFFLHEATELEKQVGVRLPARGPRDEVTDTETHTTQPTLGTKSPTTATSAPSYLSSPLAAPPTVTPPTAHLEKPWIFKLVSWALAALAVAMIVVILRLIRTPSL